MAIVLRSLQSKRPVLAVKLVSGLEPGPKKILNYLRVFALAAPGSTVVRGVSHGAIRRSGTHRRNQGRRSYCQTILRRLAACAWRYMTLNLHVSKLHKRSDLERLSIVEVLVKNKPAIVPSGNAESWELCCACWYPSGLVGQSG